MTLEKFKSTSVPIPGEEVQKLNEISATRKDEGNLAWSQKNILVEIIRKEYRRIFK